MIKKYVKKPIPIEAVQWLGANVSEILNFCHKAEIKYSNDVPFTFLYINTLEGQMAAQQGDYIIKGIHGEFYPCAKDIFEESYEEYVND